MATDTVRVLVNGARGKMGQAVVQAVGADSQLTLCGTSELGDDLREVILKTEAQVVVDFTTAAAGFSNTELILHSGARPVIGTSGFTEEQVKKLQLLAASKNLGGVIAPNFAIGVVLLMKFAQEAARYLPHVEIMELHHDRKADAPSGTAVRTAEMIADVREQVVPNEEHELFTGARGATVRGVHVHSIRLPGLVAHQEVVFGGLGQTLSIRHDSLSRDSFMPGVCMACKKVMETSKLHYGLEHLM